jgi:hypothetical protein
MKIHSIGPAYANIMHREDVGVKKMEDLAKANPDDLLKKIIASNKKRRLVKVVPTIAKVKRWINEAKTTK